MQANAERLSVVYVTRFEHAKVVGMREEQISRGAPSTLSDAELQGLSSVSDIVKKELDTGKLPFKLVRTLPNGKQEKLSLGDLKPT